MRRFADIKRRFMSALAPTAIVVVAVYFGFFAVQGDRGLFAYYQLKQQKAELETELKLLKRDREALAHRVDLLSGPEIDADLLEERARILLGYGRPDDVIIIH